MPYLSGYMRGGAIVNCYDQAGAVVALGRCVGAQAKYGYRIPFGYINLVNLVGVGMCNNPFFLNSNIRCNCSPTVGSDEGYPRRSAFGNHAVAMLNKDVFDACAGPIVGTPVGQYVLQVVDVSASHEQRAARNSALYEEGTIAPDWVRINGTLQLLPNQTPIVGPTSFY